MNLFSKKNLLGAFLLAFEVSNAQFTICDSDGSVIEDDSVYQIGTVDEETAKLDLHIQNDSSEPIGVKARMLEIDGSDGTNVQLCLGDCFLNVIVNSPLPIAVGQTTNVGTYFWNRNDTSNYIVYRFKVYRVDSFGSAIGTPVHINDVYDASLSVPATLQQMGININNTIVKDLFSFTAEDNLNVEVFDLNGKVLAQYQTEAGQQTLNMASLQNAIYIVKFASKEGKTAYSKIVKQ